MPTSSEVCSEALRREAVRGLSPSATWPGALKVEMPKLTVYLLARRSQFEAIFPRWLKGFFSRDGDEPFIVLHGSAQLVWRRSAGGGISIAASEIARATATPRVLVNSRRYLVRRTAVTRIADPRFREIASSGGSRMPSTRT